MNQLAAFLAATCTTDDKMTPSLRVDQFWHGFVLHTKPHADFWAAHGRFIHHVPDRGRHNPEEGLKALALTGWKIRAAGFTRAGRLSASKRTDRS
ncbi:MULTISPECIES: hypothetical protein [Streptomyces]|uniref:hypothetical protein n=1 Tax=Streptomyces TaxID=1883 RepID=UPI001676DC08|nr:MULTISPECIES: hypothetical protein [Streptomyces]MBK3527438.1 hypothetical protein [Streptomyces sp. MBT70]GGR64228.1 hypothetical protein GCM10010236_16920 [Streptomyces eurythermus]